MIQQATSGRTGLVRAAALLIVVWALAGGAVLVLVMLMNVLSVGLGMSGSSFPGDFELTEIGVAIAAFAFLPFVQLTGGNVTADIFTAGAGPATRAVFHLLAAVVAALFAALLAWRMSAGMISQREYGYVTAIVQFPIWTAFIPVLASLALLVVGGLITAAEAVRDLKRAATA